MAISLFPFKYYSVLPDYTLANRIREESWKLDRLFPLLKKSKSELKRSLKGIHSNPSYIPKLQHSIAMLAAEIRTGVKDLKLINFYDSAILYLYFKLLRNVFGLCSEEEKRLKKEKDKAASTEIKLNNKKLEEIMKTKKEIEKNVKKYEGSIKGLGIAEKDLAEAYQKLSEELEKLRWSTEKQAQQEFRFLKFTFRSMENLSRKIKVAVIKVKNLAPEKTFLINRVQKQPSHEDVIGLAKLVSKSIDGISKDVLYSSKLISQFEKEMKRLEKIVENLKKALNKNRKISMETAKKLIKPWDEAVEYLESEVHKDLMEIFRNIFVEYKHVGTRKLAA